MRDSRTHCIIRIGWGVTFFWDILNTSVSMAMAADSAPPAPSAGSSLVFEEPGSGTLVTSTRAARPGSGEEGSMGTQVGIAPKLLGVDALIEEA